MDYPFRLKEDLLFKAPLTASVVSQFLSSFRSLKSPQNSIIDQPYVYVDADGVKLVTSIAEESDQEENGIFALSVAEDGWVEMLATQD